MYLVGATVALLTLLSGCKELDGRNRNRKANRLFRDKHFIDATAEYEKALKTVEDPIIHYNLGLAYSKVVRAGAEKPILLGVKGEFVCNNIPGVKEVEARWRCRERGAAAEEAEEGRSTAASSGSPGLWLRLGCRLGRRRRLWQRGLGKRRQTGQAGQAGQGSRRGRGGFWFGRFWLGGFRRWFGRGFRRFRLGGRRRSTGPQGR